jgi:uncharacterized protein
MICADPRLSEQDEHLARAYRVAIETTGEADAIRTAQRQWLNQLSSCPNASCISDAQELRIAELEDKIAAAPKSPKVGSQIDVSEHDAFTITAVRGIGTRKAAIDTRPTEQDAATYCQREEAANPKCIADWMNDHRTGAKELRADCQTGIFSAYGTQLALLGRNAVASPANPEEPDYLIKSLKTGAILETFSYTNYSTFLSAFRTLCPGVAEHSPLVDRPTTFPDCSDPEFVTQAKDTVVSAGYSHLMNIKIIDLENIRTISTSATDKQCSAAVMLNTGENLVLFYRSYTKNHKLFMQTRLSP